jgi:hypothetical protein
LAGFQVTLIGRFWVTPEVKLFADYRKVCELTALVLENNHMKDSNGLFCDGYLLKQNTSVFEQFSELSTESTAYAMLVNSASVALAGRLERAVVGKTEVHFIPQAEWIKQTVLTLLGDIAH